MSAVWPNWAIRGKWAGLDVEIRWQDDTLTVTPDLASQRFEAEAGFYIGKELGPPPAPSRTLDHHLGNPFALLYIIENWKGLTITAREGTFPSGDEDGDLVY